MPSQYPVIIVEKRAFEFMAPLPGLCIEDYLMDKFRCEILQMQMRDLVIWVVSNPTQCSQSQNCRLTR